MKPASAHLRMQWRSFLYKCGCCLCGTPITANAIYKVTRGGKGNLFRLTKYCAGYVINKSTKKQELIWPFVTHVFFFFCFVLFRFSLDSSSTTGLASLDQKIMNNQTVSVYVWVTARISTNTLCTCSRTGRGPLTRKVVWPIRNMIDAVIHSSAPDGQRQWRVPQKDCSTRIHSHTWVFNCCPSPKWWWKHPTGALTALIVILCLNVHVPKVVGLYFLLMSWHMHMCEVK